MRYYYIGKRVMMYLPLIIMVGMIGFVFVSYAINYIGMFIWNEKYNVMRKDVNGVVFNNKFIIEETFKGWYVQVHYGVFVVIIWNTFWLVFSIIKAAVVDPGYLPSPIEMEFNYLVNNNNTSNNTVNAHCLSKFYIQSQNGPLTGYESNIIINNLYKHCYSTIYNVNAFATNTSLTTSSERRCNVDKDNNCNVVLCAYCIRWKPERCHHCRKCNKCVLKMDHHCPWLVNCVGFNNYKYFVLCIIYGSINTILITLTYVEYVIAINLSTTFSISFCVWNTFAFMCNFLLMCFSCYLLCVHIKRVLLNITSIEHAEKVKSSFEGVSITKDVNYNKGICLNIIEVFGDNPLLWLLPFNTYQKGNGIIYNNSSNSSIKVC